MPQKPIPTAQYVLLALLGLVSGFIGGPLLVMVWISEIATGLHVSEFLAIATLVGAFVGLTGGLTLPLLWCRRKQAREAQWGLPISQSDETTWPPAPKS